MMMENSREKKQGLSRVLLAALFGVVLLTSASSCGRKTTPLQPDVPPVVKPDKPKEPAEPDKPKEDPDVPPPPASQDYSLRLSNGASSAPAFTDITSGIVVAVEQQ